MRRRNFRTIGNPLTVGSVGSFKISESNIKKQTNKQKNTKNNNTKNTCLTATVEKITLLQKALT